MPERQKVCVTLLQHGDQLLPVESRTLCCSWCEGGVLADELPLEWGWKLCNMENQRCRDRWFCTWTTGRGVCNSNLAFSRGMYPNRRGHPHGSWWSYSSKWRRLFCGKRKRILRRHQLQVVDCEPNLLPGLVAIQSHGPPSWSSRSGRIPQWIGLYLQHPSLAPWHRVI